MWAPDLLHWSLAGVLALAAFAVLWCARLSGVRSADRAYQAQSLALERKVAALRRVEEHYRGFVEQAPVGIFRTRPSGCFLSANGKMAKLLGYSSIGEMLEQVSDIGRQHYADPGVRAEMYRQVLAEGMLRNHEVRLRRRDGATVWLSLSLRAVRDETGAIDHVEGFAVDVTDRKQAEEALAGSERMYRQMLRWMRDILYRLDPEGRIVFVSHAVTRYGYVEEELLGRDISELVGPEDREGLRRNLAERRTGERRTSGVEFRLEPGPGLAGQENPPPVMYLEAEGIYEVDPVGALRFLGSIGMARDITRRKLAEERLTQSLAAKELLLQELRHRVKNNLNVMQSLISLTSSRTATPEAARVCREISGYVRCMAAMHSLLSRAPAGDHVNLADMVRDIYAAASGLFPGLNVAADFALADVPLHLDKALPCGMLLNELFTNAFKHAFPDGRPGRVSVDLARRPDGWARLEVADNGVGCGGDGRACGLGVGMGLLRSLSAQLGAKLDLEAEGGTVARLEFDPGGDRDRLRGLAGSGSAGRGAGAGRPAAGPAEAGTHSRPM
jgi:PAS domain S-box-containing protein